MIVLPREKYGRVLPLLESVACDALFAEVVAYRRASGFIFVDDAERPTQCLIAHKYGMALLTGVPNGPFCQDLCAFLLGGQNTVKWILVYPDSLREIWYRFIPGRIFDRGELSGAGKGSFLRRTKRVMFDFAGNAPLNDRRIGNVRKMVVADFNRLEGSEAPKKFWNTAKDFETNGMGFILERDNAVASYCFSSFSHGGRIEIGVETDPLYRGNGFATVLASRLANCCLERNVRPLWSCRIENEASMRLARKTGFAPSSEHEYFIVAK